MKILNIVPVPVPPEALDSMAAQLPRFSIHPEFENTFVSAKAGGSVIDSPYEQTLCDVFVLEAGARAEEQGYDGVCINSMSDSALAALRSRLSIPVVAPSQSSMLLASLLGKRFSIITMWPQWHAMYLKVAQEQGLSSRLASVRDIGVRPDTAELLAGKEEFVFPELERQAREAIDVDGADVIVLGSTTMHQSHGYLRQRLEVPVLSPGLVAYKMCESLVLMGLSHSKKAFPSPERPQDDLFASIPAVFG